MRGRPLTAATLTARRAALLLAALAAVPFARVVFAGHVLYEREIHILRWAEAEGFARCVAAGSLPLWNALAGFGRPLLADPGAQALYPWTWLGLFLQPDDWYDVYALAHVALGGIGVLALARRLGSSVAGSFFAPEKGVVLATGPATAARDGEPGVANGGSLGVPLGAGRHHVELVYRPRSLLAGAALSGLALVGGGLLLALRATRSKAAAAAPPPGDAPA